eukprot:6700148-Alexandrium_andersonii.AAC.1
MWTDLPERVRGGDHVSRRGLRGSDPGARQGPRAPPPGRRSARAPDAGFAHPDGDRSRAALQTSRPSA